MLTDKYQRGAEIPPNSRLASWGMSGTLTDERFDVIEALQAYAADRGISLLDVAIGALAAQPAVDSVIAGATSAEQVRSNVAAGEWQPTEEDLEALDKIVPSSRPS